MTKLKTFIFMLSMFLVTTGAMAQYRPSSKSRSRSSITQNRSGNQNRSRNQNRSNQSSSLCPDNKHPHMIDLGLPSGTKWACCNVGANKPQAYGGYYAWGETEEKEDYSDSTYKYYRNDDYVNIGSDIAGTQYDVAHVKWGGGWRMPTFDQIKELHDNCIYKWTTINGVEGGKFTSRKNGKSIFLPAEGDRLYGNLDNAGSYGYYWSSTQYPSISIAACGLLFFSGYAGCNNDDYRYDGQPVRPVSR